MSLVCECGGKSGFTNLGHGYDQQWWVCAACQSPTKPWLAAQGDDMLNFFRGGPLDGTAYTTSTLLDGSQGGPGWTAQLAEYKWTPEVVVSEKTGASARVWVHKSQAPADPMPQPAVSTQAAAGQSSPAPNEEGATMAKKNEQTLEDRRKAGGFSRNQVAEATGLTVSKVYRIEKGGARTTEEETAQLVAGLDKLEADAAANSPE